MRVGLKVRPSARVRYRAKAVPEPGENLPSSGEHSVLRMRSGGRRAETAAQKWRYSQNSGGQTIQTCHVPPLEGFSRFVRRGASAAQTGQRGFPCQTPSVSIRRHEFVPFSKQSAPARPLDREYTMRFYLLRSKLMAYNSDDAWVERCFPVALARNFLACPVNPEKRCEATQAGNGDFPSTF